MRCGTGVSEKAEAMELTEVFTTEQTEGAESIVALLTLYLVVNVRYLTSLRISETTGSTAAARLRR